MNPVWSAPLSREIRAELAESELLAVRVQNHLIGGELASARAETERLQTIVRQQAAQLDALREELRWLRTEVRRVQVEELVRSFARALRLGSEALEGRTIVAADAEIRAPLVVSGDAGLVVSDATSFDPSALSTIRFQLRTLPPHAGETRPSQAPPEQPPPPPEPEPEPTPPPPELDPAALAALRSAAERLAWIEPGDVNPLALVAAEPAAAGAQWPDAVASLRRYADERLAELPPEEEEGIKAPERSPLRQLPAAIDEVEAVPPSLPPTDEELVRAAASLDRIYQILEAAGIL
jgi:hypothetical protein